MKNKKSEEKVEKTKEKGEKHNVIFQKKKTFEKLKKNRD